MSIDGCSATSVCQGKFTRCTDRLTYSNGEGDQHDTESRMNPPPWRHRLQHDFMTCTLVYVDGAYL